MLGANTPSSDNLPQGFRPRPARAGEPSKDPGSAPEPFGGTLTRAMAALAATAGVLALALFIASGAGGLFDVIAGMNDARSWAQGEYEALATARLALFLIAFQAASILLTILAAAAFGKGRERLLPLSPPSGGTLAVFVSVAALLVLASFYGAAIYLLDKRAIITDAQPFVQILQSRTWWLMLIAAAVGAPIAEELLFRGFLYGVLRRTAAGIAGAALVSSFVWACMHASYTIYGMAAIFLIGLYLAWVREKTQSLITPIVCHGLYNGLIVAVLASAPDTVFKLG